MDLRGKGKVIPKPEQEKLPAPEGKEQKRLPAGQGFKLKKQTKLRKAKRGIETEVEYKPVLTKSGKPFATKGTATKVLNEGPFDNKYTVVKYGDGFAIQRTGHKLTKELEPHAKKALEKTPKVKESWEPTREERSVAKKELSDSPPQVKSAVFDSARGVIVGHQTRLDDAFDIKGQEKGYWPKPMEVYNSFSGSRELIRKRHGDTVLLHRLQGDERLIPNKHTLNWTTRRDIESYKKSQPDEYTNRKLISKEIPVNDILVVNVGKDGKYQECVVLNRDSKGFIDPVKQAIAQGKIKSHPDYPELTVKESPQVKINPKDYKSVDEFVASHPTVYHGTKEQFTEFSDTKLGSSTGAKSAKMGHFFTDSVENANYYTKTVIDNIESSVQQKVMNELDVTFRSTLMSKSFGMSPTISAKDAPLKNKKDILNVIGKHFDKEITETKKDIVASSVNPRDDLAKIDKIVKQKEKILSMWDAELKRVDVKKPEIKEVFLDYKNPYRVKLSGTDIYPIFKDGSGLKHKGYSSVLEYAKKNNYDAVIMEGAKDPIKATNTIVFSDKQIKTKPQLTDIWNKANKVEKPKTIKPSGTKLYSGLDPAMIVDTIRTFKGQYKQAKPYIEELGRRAYKKAKDFKSWSGQMKSFLGDLWGSFKNRMQDVWDSLKRSRFVTEERGSVSTEKHLKSVLEKRRARDKARAESKKPEKKTRKPKQGKEEKKLKSELKKSERKLKSAEKKLADVKTNKDILKRRRGKIKAIRDYFNLSDYDLKKISQKDIRLMDNFEFKKFIDDLKVRAEGFDSKRQALNEVEVLRREKQLVNEHNIRKLNDLPTVKKMTEKQLDEYYKILDSYERGDQFLSPKRIGALKNTAWEGAKTHREVMQMASKLLDVPVKKLKQIKVSEGDRFRYDTSLARRNPFYNFAVDMIKESEIKNQFKYFNEREKLYGLGKEALKSTKRGIGGRIVPRQKNIMKYIEADTAGKSELIKAMTPQQIALADYIMDFNRRAFNWLKINKDLKYSRFSDDQYVFHSKRPISELVADIGDAKIKDTMKDILRRWKLDEAGFKVVDSKTGEILSMKKFFRQTQFRTGELIPSKNIIRSTDIYMQQFFKKMAIDESVVAIETLAMALHPKTKAGTTGSGLLLDDSLKTFLKEYLNNKKGRSINFGGVSQGGKIDIAIRLVNNLVTLKYIAGNIPLQLASIVGESSAKLIALGNRKLAIANARKLTPRGRRILKKYKAFVGEGVLEGMNQPARNIGDNASDILYGLFKWNRKITKQDMLLGNMTRAEFKAEAISGKKLAQMTKEIGRWVDVGDAESIIGSTSAGKSITKFKQWAIPMASSTLDNSASLLRTLTRLGDKNKRLTKKQFQEFYRIAEIGLLVVAVSAVADEDNRDSFSGNLKFYAKRELSTFFNAINPTTILTAGVVVDFLESLMKNLHLIAIGDKYKEKPGLKGVTALKKQLTPAIVKQFKSGEKKEQKIATKKLGG